IQITPLQAANLYATIASGVIRRPTLIHDDPRPRPPRDIPGAADHALSTVREGLYRCVNLPGGTAYEGARMDEMVVCGKTGSAQAVSRVVKWRIQFRSSDNETVELEAPSVDAARDRLDPAKRWQVVKRTPLERWPPPEGERGKMRTHAWFAGFAPREEPRI